MDASDTYAATRPPHGYTSQARRAPSPPSPYASEQAASSFDGHAFHAHTTQRRHELRQDAIDPSLHGLGGQSLSGGTYNGRNEYGSEERNGHSRARSSDYHADLRTSDYGVRGGYTPSSKNTYETSNYARTVLNQLPPPTAQLSPRSRLPNGPPVSSSSYPVILNDTPDQLDAEHTFTNFQDPPATQLQEEQHTQPFPNAPSSNAATPTRNSDPTTPTTPSTPAKPSASHISGLKIVFDPPDLEQWRQRLFHVEDTLTLTEDQFMTYFPHVDNVYSHRSTQHYKRKPFVSHYWDCRLKGRPPGTPKSDDPLKKKRKRMARERDLCDVKIKITEFLGEDTREEGEGDRRDRAESGTATMKGDARPSANAQRYFTIQRISGGPHSAARGEPAVHKHTLAESDRIKKNSVERDLITAEKERRKGPKTYHKRATGVALDTVKQHSSEHELKLYGGCFCPFVQRVWIALEFKGLSYQYIEVDPYKKPPSLLALSPQGLVPALQHGSFSLHESSVILEYIEEAFPSSPLLPHSPQLRAQHRLWADHVSKKILPLFYKTLQAQETSKQASAAADLKTEIDKLVRAADPEGPFFGGKEIGFLDVHIAPWVLRLRRVLAPYRGWPEPETNSRWGKWIDALEECDAVKKTTSDDELYLDSYERYAENRPGTSQVADAVNRGGSLP